MCPVPDEAAAVGAQCRPAVAALHPASWRFHSLAETALCCLANPGLLHDILSLRHVGPGLQGCSHARILHVRLMILVTDCWDPEGSACHPLEHLLV